MEFTIHQASDIFLPPRSMFSLRTQLLRISPLSQPLLRFTNERTVLRDVFPVAMWVNRPTIISFASRAFSGKAAETRSDENNMLHALNMKKPSQPENTIHKYITGQEEKILKVKAVS
jgi:hypothetical protein